MIKKKTLKLCDNILLFMFFMNCNKKKLTITVDNPRSNMPNYYLEVVVITHSVYGKTPSILYSNYGLLLRPHEFYSRVPVQYPRIYQ